MENWSKLNIKECTYSEIANMIEATAWSTGGLGTACGWWWRQIDNCGWIFNNTKG